MPKLSGAVALLSLRFTIVAVMALCLGGCVSADLGDIAPTSFAIAEMDAAASDFASAPARPGVSTEATEQTEIAASPGRPAGEPETEIRVAAFAPLPPMSQGADVDKLISKYAAHYGLREEFVRKVVKRESTFNPRAYNRGHWGLMQIKHQTARGMGYRGPAAGLFDAETNLIYGVRYLRGAWLVAGGDEAYADRLYQSGYYYHAKRAGLLDETGLGRDRIRKRRRG